MSSSSIDDALVSICITSYNYGRYIRDAIESALNQTHRNIEVVVSDNASTDDTHAILATYAGDARVRIFVNDENVEMCRNHNLAIMRSRGAYIVVLSADDILYPTHVETLLRRINDPLDPVLIAYGQGVEVTETLEPVRPVFAYGDLLFPYSGRDDFGNTLFIYHHMYPAKLIARSVYDRVGLFDERIVNAIDIEMVVRFEEVDIPTAFVPELLAGLRDHGSRRSSGRKDLAETNLVFSDKLYAYEHALLPQNAWRIEGYERHILAVLADRAKSLPADGNGEINEMQCARLESVCREFETLSTQTPQWPENEPTLSIVIASEGYLALLKATLDAIAVQQGDRIEVVIMQTSGCDVRPVVTTLGYQFRIRIFQVRVCQSTSQVHRYGLDMARGEFITYLEEGQRFGPALYVSAIAVAREYDARVLMLPRESIDESFPTHIIPELHPHAFEKPASRAWARVGAAHHALCHVVHRRAAVRHGSTIYELMLQEPAVFLAHLTGSFPTIMLGMSESIPV